jgi:hypothetical protein
MEPLESGVIDHILKLLTKTVDFKAKNYVDFLMNWRSI